MQLERPLLLAGLPWYTARWRTISAPWDGRAVTHVAEAGPLEASTAAQAATRAFGCTRSMPMARRAAILATAAARLGERREELVAALRDEGGKPLSLARAEVDEALEAWSSCAADLRRGDTAPGCPTVVTRLAPRGPVLVLTPFNLPLLRVCEKLAAAVRTGCPIVVVPAAQTPSPALIAAEALVAAGWPEEAVSVLPGDEALTPLLDDTRFATVLLNDCGRAGARRHMDAGRRRIVWEPCPPTTTVLEPDADLERAVTAVVEGAFAHAGQLGAPLQRVLVHADVLAQARARLVAAAAGLARGDPAREDVVCGPLIDDRAARRVEDWLGEAVHLGAAHLAGGEREGSVTTPAVVEAEDPFVQLCGSGPLGPVLVLEPYPCLDAAISRLNAQIAGGAVGLFTRALPRVFRAFDALAASVVVHDAHPGVRMDPVADLADARTLRL